MAPDPHFPSEGQRQPEPPDGLEPTDEERRAIATLERLARRWPDTIYLASMGGALHVMRKGPSGHEELTGWGGGLDPYYSLASIPIENTGGDW